MNAQEKYSGQQCQDKAINDSFRRLHKEIVNKVILWCREHNIVVDDFSMHAYDLPDSIKEGKWMGSTDSFFALKKYTQDYKDACNLDTVVDDEEFKEMESKQKPYIFSC